jgi:hypothetical protein
MIWPHGFHGSQYILTLAAACFSAIPQQAVAAQVQAYAIFEVASSANVTATVDKLRSTSLGNCLQLVVGAHARDVILHVACDESSTDTSYLNQAMVTLSKVDGISRATIVSLKQGAS